MQMDNQNHEEYGSFDQTTMDHTLLKEDEEEPKQAKFAIVRGRVMLKFLPVVFFAMMLNCSIMGSKTIFPQYILDLFQKEQNFSVLGNTTINTCYVNKSDPLYQTYTQIQQDSSNFLAVASFAGGLPNLVSVVILGALSDKLGRKKIIYIAYTGLVLLNVGLSLLINLDLPLWVYLIFTFVNGCCGSSGAMFAAIFAHVADVTTKQERALVIAIVEFSFALAALIVNLILGAVIKAVGFRVPIIGLCVLCVLSILFMIRVEESSPGRLDTMSTFEVIRAPFTKMRMLLSLNRQRSIAIFLLATAFMLYELILTSSEGVSTLYLMGIPFCWDSFLYGVYTGGKVGFQIIICTFLIALSHRINNDSLIMFGMISFTASNLLIAAASGFAKPDCDILVIISIGLGGLSSLPVIFSRSQASTLVKPDEQGAIFGLMSTGESFATSFGPTITSILYGATVSFLPGLVFYFSAGLVFIGFILVVMYKIVAAPLRLALNYNKSSQYVASDEQ